MKDGQAVRALVVGLVTQGHKGDRGIRVPLDQLAHQDTVTRTHVWDTMLEVSSSIQMIFKPLVDALTYETEDVVFGCRQTYTHTHAHIFTSVKLNAIPKLGGVPALPGKMSSGTKAKFI